MSTEAVGYVLRFSPYRGNVFLVHLAVADSVNDQHGNEFFMAQGKLALKARVPRENVNRALAALVEGGFLADRGTVGTKGIRRFRFLFPKVPVAFDSRVTSDHTDDETLSSDVTPPVTTRHTDVCRDVTQNPSSNPIEVRGPALNESAEAPPLLPPEVERLDHVADQIAALRKDLHGPLKGRGGQESEAEGVEPERLGDVDGADPAEGHHRAEHEQHDGHEQQHRMMVDGHARTVPGAVS